MNNIVIEWISDFIYDIKFIIFDEIYMNRMIIDFVIDILFVTFIRDMNIYNIIKNIKMR